MAEFFIELLSEEIPARMQSKAAQDLQRLVSEALAGLAPANFRSFFGPRRIALAAELAPAVPASTSSERGPRTSAPPQALAGFLRKHQASESDLVAEGEFWMLNRIVEPLSAADLITATLPGILRRFPWPKAMRWGGTSQFTWVRPLRRILCLLDRHIVPFELASGADDGHGLVAGRLTEGHRFHAPGAVPVEDAANWVTILADCHVIADYTVRRQVVADGLQALAAAKGIELVDDPGLLDEVAGLVEWPVPLLGRIDDDFMDLPAEVMQVSMRVNQRYFATRSLDGSAAPWFAFAANVAAPDGGLAIVAGNERVLRARFSDARHFWDLDRKTRLEHRVEALDGITLHAELGTQGQRVKRVQALAGFIASALNADRGLAERAALLAKADLTTGMVGEFPELQGIMGGYYARHDGEDPRVADAVRDHYTPKGPTDSVPHDPVGISVALADKIDQVMGFFSIGQGPSGSGDPFALRRAALGVLRIVRENAIRLDLASVFAEAARPLGVAADISLAVQSFFLERLRVQIRSEGGRPDILSAALGDQHRISSATTLDIVRVLTLSHALAAVVSTSDGRDLLAAYKRAVNILRIEDKRDGPHRGEPDRALVSSPAEIALWDVVIDVKRAESLVQAEQFEAACALLATLRAPLDAFFEATTVNDPDQAVRRNRLRLLWNVRQAIEAVADFSQIEN